MQYDPKDGVGQLTEAELTGLSGDAMAADEAQAAFYEEQAGWEHQAHHYHEQEQEQLAWEEGE
ncbi:hypothetical protein GCM10023185_42040 [Hymenobacter saemangeumensis]|uniref:EF-hand domain-containing protein n=1 Tax=Hymenobacter saemangeumensis TaxID=1084522 RepID=A0ABP8IRK3_9BACT